MEHMPALRDPDSRAAVPVSIPLYAAGFVASASGLLSVGLTFSDDTSFVILTVLLTAIGFVVSYLSRVQNLSSASIELPAVLIFAAICLLTFVNEQAPAFLGPAGGTEDRARAISVLLVWLVVIRSFTLTTDARILFCCVPTIALVGLTSTMSTDPALVTYFVAFVASSVFLVIHENFLRSSVHARLTTAGNVFLKAQIQAAAACALISMFIANILAIPMQAVGSSFTLNRPSGSSQQQRSQGSQNSSTVSVREESEIRVARGPVQLSDQILMRITSEQESYWRGASFDTYTGRGWRNTLERQLPLQPSGSGGAFGASQLTSFQVPTTEYNTVGEKSRILRQTVRLEGSGIFSEVYAAPEVRMVQLPLELAYHDESGAIRLATSLQGVAYQVESQVPEYNTEILRAVSSPPGDAIKSKYLAWQAPTLKDGGQRLKSLAEDLTREYSNTFDKVAALEAWVGRQCKYNTAAGAAPEEKDVVEHFLFDAKQGYCDGFATSLAVLCRSIGIPARVASGFQPGEHDVTSGSYVVREKDKHLWTEVYFEGIGWVPFDATSLAEDISPRNLRGEPWYRSLLALISRRGWLPPLAFAVFMGTLLFILKTEVLDRVRSRRVMGVPSTLPASNLQIIDTYLQMRGRLKRKGVPNSPALTPAEYRLQVMNTLTLTESASAALDKLTQLVETARYSRLECSPEQAAEARALARAAAAGAEKPRQVPAQSPSAS
jgi:transglutaminase-like putative cysteine protease